MTQLSAQARQRADLVTLRPVTAWIDQRLAHEGRAVVVLDGQCGAGKTTLAQTLAKRYQTAPIHMDDFFLPQDMRTPDRLQQPGGNLHRERFAQEVLEGLAQGGDVHYRRYDCQTGQYLPRTHARTPLCIIEGSYSHHPAFGEAYRALGALRVFVMTDEAEQRRRLALRDPAKLERFQSLWIPLEKTYFEAYDIQGAADVRLINRPWQDA